MPSFPPLPAPSAAMPAASARCWPPHCRPSRSTACTPASPIRRWRHAGRRRVGQPMGHDGPGARRRTCHGDVGDRQRRGRSPRTTNRQPPDIAGISSADIAVVNGAGYDTWASTAAETAGIDTIDVGALAGVKEGGNPHLWFSAQARTAAADAITDRLRRRRPRTYGRLPAAECPVAGARAAAGRRHRRRPRGLRRPRRMRPPSRSPPTCSRIWGWRTSPPQGYLQAGVERERARTRRPQGVH